MCWREGDGFAGGRGLIGGGRDVAERVGGAGAMVPGEGETEIDDADDEEERDHDGGDLPVEFRKLEGDEIDDAFFLIGERGRFAEFFGLAEFLVEFGHDVGDVELEHHGVGAHETADVHWRGEDVEVAFLEGADVVGADFGDVRDLMDGEALGLARALKLFGNRRHNPSFSLFYSSLATL